MARTKEARMEGEARAEGDSGFPPLHFEATCRAPAAVVYDLLADLSAHMEWAGERQGQTTRLLTMDAPQGPAHVGTEFRTTGSDGKVAVWHDRSVVTEATQPSAFEFVTEGVRHRKPGSTPWEATTVHRYEITPTPDGCRVTYSGPMTRMVGFPAITRFRLVRRLMIRMAAKYMGRGFHALVALAEERAGVAPAAE